MPGRRWSEGLHQAIEAKEGLRVQRESVTLATITFQNYFRLYEKLSGMTGTAMTEQEEFYKIYGLEVVSVPTHRPMVRDDYPDLVFRDEDAKFNALIDEVAEMQEAGRPVLVGTVSVEKSEVLSTMLKRRGIRHEVLNAKFHEKEAPIVAQAGRSGAVTIATNMAGRGTDILLGGNAAGLASATLHARRASTPRRRPRRSIARRSPRRRRRPRADHERVVEAGGLHIIGTERHDARRIDNQLRGRAGRQGDPGSSRFYLSLEDTLLKRFASDRVTGLMERMGLEGDVAIESQARVAGRSRTPSRASRATTSTSASASSSTTTSSTSSARRSTPSATRCSATRTSARPSRASSRTSSSCSSRRTSATRSRSWTSTGSRGRSRASGSRASASTRRRSRSSGRASAIQEAVLDAAATQLEDRAPRSYGAETWALVERAVLLRAIDQLWVDHLTELDDFRRGVGLRGYARHRPARGVQARGLQALRGAARLHPPPGGLARSSGSTSSDGPPPRRPRCRRSRPQQLAALRAGAPRSRRTVTERRETAWPRQPLSVPRASPHRAGRPRAPSSSAGSRTAAPRQMQLQRGDQTVGVASSAAAGSGQPAEAAKLGRNDPCWCGSGKKFKRCHGS